MTNSPDPDRRTGWRDARDLRVGVISDWTDAELTVHEQVTLTVFMLEPARWARPGEELRWRSVDHDRMASRAGHQPITTPRILARLRAERWLEQDDAGAWSYGPRLRQSVNRWSGTGNGWRGMYSPHDVGALLDEGARRAGDSHHEAWAPQAAMLLVARTVSAGSAAVYEGSQARLARTIGVDAAEACRGLQYLERLGLVVQGRRHMATSPGDAEPRAQCLGNALHKSMLRYCRRHSTELQAVAWIDRHGRAAPRQPHPELALDGHMPRRRRRQTAQQQWQSRVARNVRIRQTRGRQCAAQRSAAATGRRAPP